MKKIGQGHTKNGAKGNNMENERRYMRTLRYCLAGILAGLVFGTLFAFANPQELAKINGTTITEKDFRERVMILPEKDRKAAEHLP